MGDFLLLQKMGCNTIRMYHHSSSNPDIQKLFKGQPSETYYNHPPNKELMRDLFQTYGIRIAMGDLLGSYTIGTGASWDEGTDYNDPIQRANMFKSVEDMVLEHKDEPYILMWILGNENNYAELTNTNASEYSEVYAKFVNEVARRIHELDPNHPVCISHGEIKFIETLAELAPDIDIFGLNSYRQGSFGNLWDEIDKVYDKPVLLTEFGLDAARVYQGIMDEKYQARVHEAAWNDIQNHAAGRELPRNAIGGFVFEWLDNWWQDGNPWEHNTNPNGRWQHEWNGIASQGDGRASLFIRQLRKVYYTYKKMWNE